MILEKQGKRFCSHCLNDAPKARYRMVDGVFVEIPYECDHTWNEPEDWAKVKLECELAAIFDRSLPVPCKH